MRERPIRVLVSAHHFVNEVNRGKFSFLARHADLDLHVLIPHRWTGSLGEEYSLPVGSSRVTVESASGACCYTRHVHRVWFRGTNRQHFYVYGWGLGGLLGSIAPDLLHVEEEPYSLVTWQLARSMNGPRYVPFMFTSYQNIIKTYPPPFRQMEGQVLRTAAGAVVGSRDTEAVLRAKGLTSPAELIPYGVDPNVFKRHPAPDLRHALGLSPDSFVVGYMGRLEPMKWVEGLLMAMKQLPKHTSLLVIGGGGERDRLQALCRTSGLDDRVRWMPFIRHDEAPRYLNVMDCLVLPSRTLPTIREQFGRVLIEAMACETPVIGSDSGEIPHVISDGGLVFPETDVGALSTELLRLADDAALRKELGERGRARVLAHYTWEAAAKQLADLYRRVAP